MKPPMLGALLGLLLGFVCIVLLRVFVVTSPVLTALLFPGRLFIKASTGMGPFGQMIFDTLAYLVDLILYGAAGYGLGLLFQGQNNSAKGGDAS